MSQDATGPETQSATAAAASHRVTRRSVVAGLSASAALGGCIGSAGPGPLLGYPRMILDPPPGDGQLAANYPDLIGTTVLHVAGPDDTLIELARLNGLGYTEMVAANRDVDPWLPRIGTRIVLPKAHLLPAAKHEGIVLNLADQRLYLFGPGGRIDTFPIGIGSEGWKTPLGRTTVARKRANPTWYVPKSIRAAEPDLPASIPPGPDNPLGSHALYLGWPSYLIHGTNKPWGVGRRASHGCIRLYPEDIGRLFAMAPVGTPVLVVDQEAKIGWSGEDLLLELHPSQRQADELEETRELTPAPMPGLVAALRAAAGDKNVPRIDWHRVKRMVDERSGVPGPVFVPDSAA